MLTAIGGLVVAIVTSWLRGCAMVGHCRSLHLRSRQLPRQDGAAL
jgi:hypothetical protein